MHHLEIRFFHLPYSSKQPGNTWSSPVVMGSPCSWHGVVGFEGHCSAFLVEELHFFLSCVTHRIFQDFRGYWHRGHRKAAGSEGKKAAAPAVMLKCQHTPYRTAWSHSNHRGPRPGQWHEVGPSTQGTPIDPIATLCCSPAISQGLWGKHQGSTCFPASEKLSVKGLSDWQGPGGHAHI